MRVLLSKQAGTKLALSLLFAASFVTAACGGTTAGGDKGGSSGMDSAGEDTTTAPAPTASAGETVAAPGPGAAPPPTDPEALGVFFPRQERPRGDVPLANLGGELSVDDAGCLRVTYPSGDVVPVWPPEYELGAEDGAIYVLDGEGNVAAKAGDRVEMGGGEVGTSLEGIAIVGEQTRQELYRRCPGSYWIVGLEVRAAGR